MRCPWPTILFMCSACGGAAERTPAVAPVPLIVATTERGSLQSIDTDVLSPDAKIIDLAPAGDYAHVAFRFTDPDRHIASGLGVINQQRIQAQLVWPDSVTAVWWTTPHSLAFISATGSGIALLVDVDAATMNIMRERGTQLARAHPVRQSPDSAVARTRAVEYIDSVRLQLDGAATRSTLYYRVRRLIMAPGDSVAAFYVVATDHAGTQFNPAWYMLDIHSGQVEPVDSLTAIASAMPMQAAAWSSSRYFLYAKDKALYQARIGR